MESPAAPFERQGFTVDDLIDFSPEIRAEAMEIAANYRMGPLYTPPSLIDDPDGTKGTLVLPGWGGGASWPGAGVDVEAGILFVPSLKVPIVVSLAPGEPGGTNPDYMRVGPIYPPGPRGLPLVKPPYVRLTAIDLTTGEHAWQVTLGDGPRQRLIEMGVSDPGPLGGGAFTGPVVTKTLLFLGLSGSRQSGQGPVLNAFDKATGEIVHGVDLPATLTGTLVWYVLFYFTLSSADFVRTIARCIAGVRLSGQASR